jgi:MscS family membrane protein
MGSIANTMESWISTHLGLGVFGVAIAFAAREALSSLFGAFAILADRPFKAGDRLYLEGIGPGDVVDMGMRSTRIKATDNRIVIVPNQSLALGRIVNLSQPDSKVRLELKAGISYGSDADKACAILERIASETPSACREPKPRAYVSELGDLAVAITLLVYADSYREEWAVPDAIYRNALEAFKKEGIEIPYPTVTVLPRPG